MAWRSDSRLDGRVRRWARQQLRDLDIRPPLSVPQLCDKLGERRGRELRLKAHPFDSPGPFGMWVATDTRDYIFYQENTTTQHQNYIILHEIGHILAGHQSCGTDALAALLPSLGPAIIRRSLRREGYSPRHEREAELVATIVMEWAAVLDHVAPPSIPDAASTIVADALGDRQGWL